MPAQRNGHAAAGPPRILVIDDDPTILEMLRTILTEEGFHADAALTGEDALNSPPRAIDLIVLDMFLPGASGPELAERLRKKYGAEVPILVTSASPVEGESRALGAYEYLPKPFELVDLAAAIRRGLESSRRQ
jgi:DNA-binding response OmpR family regulator